MPIDPDTIDELASSPKKTVTDEGSVEERGIDDLIKADQYTSAKAVGDNPLHGLRISKCMPGGPV